MSLTIDLARAVRRPRARVRTLASSTSMESSSNERTPEWSSTADGTARGRARGRRDAMLSGASLAFAGAMNAHANAEGEKLRAIGTIGLGCWAWGNEIVFQYDETMDSELQRVFDRAVEGGVRLFDSADSYGRDGRSEMLLGKFYSECASAKKDGVILATKLAPYPWRLSSRSFVDAAKESAKRLRREKIDLGQLHWSTGNYQPLQEGALWAGIADAYDEGVIGAVGLSNYGAKDSQVHVRERGADFDVAGAVLIAF